MLLGTETTGNAPTLVQQCSNAATVIQMMRAAVLQEDRSLETVSVPLPKLRARSVLVKVLAVQLPPFTAEVVSGV